jgi:hypothetical protein
MGSALRHNYYTLPYPLRSGLIVGRKVRIADTSVSKQEKLVELNKNKNEML